MPYPETYSIADLAVRWGVSYRTVHRFVSSGKVKSFKIGNNVRVTAAEVARIENNEERTTPHEEKQEP